MRKATLFFLMLMLCTIVNSLSAQTVEIPLGGEWDFTYTGSSTEQVPDPPPASAYDTKIEVPGRWDEQLDRFRGAKWWPQAQFRTTLGPVRYLSGIGWHRKTIDVPAAWAGRAVTLTVGHAVGTTHVWLNGKYLGMNQYGVYVPYEVDLTGVLKPGQKNELLVAVDNAAPNIFGGWALLGNAGMASGLARPVTLRVASGPGRVADMYVKAGDDLKEVVWQVNLALPGQDRASPPSKLHWLVRDPKSARELARGEVDVPSFSKASQASWKARIDEIKPWSDLEPNLYLTEVRWEAADGQAIDTLNQQFGLRHWTYEGRKLFLNGEPIYLRLEFGAYYFPITGAVSVSKEYWLEHMKRVKELGLNGINFAAQVCPIEMMEAADELGVILQCGDHVTAQQANNRYYRDVWESIVRTTRHHPSIAIYGFGGELDYYDGSIKQFKTQMDLIKAMHPESLVMPQQAIRGIDYSFDDDKSPGMQREPFVHHAERLAEYAKACDLFGHYSGGAFSYDYFDTPWREMEKRFEIYQKPLVAHEVFLGASYLNPDNMAKYTGRIPPYLYSRLEQDLKAAGLIDRWPTYFDHTSRLQHICLKYCLEKVRKCDGLAGFELLGMMDMHFTAPEYAVGTLDEFLVMKPGETPAGFRRYNDASVLLLDFDNGNGLNRCYWEGEPFQSDVMLSLYGPKDIDKGTLRWRLKRGDETLRQGTQEITNVRNGRVSTLERLNITWPNVDNTTRINLSVKLEGAGYSLANDWDFWVFPKKAPPQVVAAADEPCYAILHMRYKGVSKLPDGAKERLHVVSKISPGEVDHLSDGGDILLLGAEPFTEYKMWANFYPAIGFRSHTNGGTVIAKHPIFDGHPNEGWGDWQFYPLLQGANCVLFDGAIDTVFDPILELISSAGHVRRQALIFEQRVGKGRLLVATAALDMTNASCVTFLDNLLRYCQGTQFQPRNSLDPNELLKALSPGGDPVNMLLDHSFEKFGYWISEGGRYEIDRSSAHDGKASLKLIVTKDDLGESRSFASAVVAPQVIFRRQPSRVKLSGWFRSDIPNTNAGPRITATLHYVDAPSKQQSISIKLPERVDGWQYLEKIVELAGKVRSADVKIELAAVAGTAWVDDVYFGEAPPEPRLSQTTSTDVDEEHGSKLEWKNHKVTRNFDAPVWLRLDQGKWSKGDNVLVDREGVHTLLVGKTENDPRPETAKICIDLSPPLISLDISPVPVQEAGTFTAPADTVYSVSATDNLSGVEAIEVAIDDEDYVRYSKPFELPPGRHVLKCRATDHAGNIGNEMTGEWTTGSRADSLKLNVRQP